MIIIGGMLVLFIYETRLVSNEIFSPSHKIHREVGRAKDLSTGILFLTTASSPGLTHNQHPNGHVLPRVQWPEPQTRAEIQNPWNLITRATLPLTLLTKSNSLKVMSDLPKSGWLRGRQPALT
jgi:hypothetical protein